MLQVSGNVLKQVETFKYLRVFFLDGKKRLIHEFVKQTYSIAVMCELHRSRLKTRTFNTAKLKRVQMVFFVRSSQISFQKNM